MKFIICLILFSFALWLAEFGWNTINRSFLNAYSHVHDYDIGRASLLASFALFCCATMPWL